jgi:hypothetical protein
MLWSRGGALGGYLYFCLLSSDRPLWEFAPCGKTKLNDVTLQDLSTKFVGVADNTNGPAAFGTNWGYGIRVSEGQLILARPLGRAGQAYALQVTKQDLNRAVIDYLEVPQ